MAVEPTRPTLDTRRLCLRPFALADVPVVARLAGDPEIASTTLSIPHPYDETIAEQWIGTHQEQHDRGESAPFAIVIRAGETLVGAIGLHVNARHVNAELGYWIGRPYWGQGYATEAAAAVVRYGFDVFGLQRIHAWHFVRNPASGRVMQKIGMTYEGCLRRHVKKGESFEDAVVYGILRGERRS